MILLFFLLMLVPQVAQATTYWVSPAGGSSTCSAVDGEADPGVYMTLSQIDTSNCAVAGDTVVFKPGTYTGTAKSFELIVPSGSSSSTRSSVLCETDRACVIAFSSVSQSAMVGALNVSYYRIGARGQGFKTDCANYSTTSACYGIRLGLSGTASQTDVIIEGNEIVNNTKDAINNAELNPTGGIYTNLYIGYNKAIEPGTPNIGSGDPHAFYLAARDSILEHNEGKPFAVSGSVCLHLYHIATGNIVRNNFCHIQDSTTGIVVSDSETGLPGNSLIYKNVFKALGSSPASCMSFLSGSDSSEYYGNVCDGFNNYFYNIRAGANNNILKNNVCGGGTCGRSNLGTGTDFGGTATTTNPTITMATHFADPTNGDYSLIAGSSLIDTGLDVGLPYNGSAPDLGAFETFVFSACEVQAGATSNIVVTFTNNVAPPLLPATGITTFTARRNGLNNAVTASVNRVGDNTLTIPVTTAYIGGDTVDISGSVWNLTDSSLIGGTKNQPYVGTLTNQSCTNNAGGASYTFTQAAYELHYWIGSEASPVIIPYGYASSGTAENYANFPVMKGGRIRVRFAVVCGVSDCPSTGFHLFRSTGGGYTQLGDSFGATGGFKFCGVSTESSNPLNGAPTTNQLSTAGTFVPGGVVFTSNAIPTITGLNTGYKTELEYCVDVRDTATGFVDLRVYKQDGTALNTYTVTPRLVIEEIAAGSP